MIVNSVDFGVRKPEVIFMLCHLGVKLADLGQVV